MAEDVLGVEEFRKQLPTLVARLREGEGPTAVPVGRHRRRDAVLVSAAEYDKLVAARHVMEEAERLGALALVDARAGAELVEGTVDDLFTAVDQLLE